MPTYEYECDACGHAFERIQRMVDPAVRKCPACRKLKVRRLISGGAGVIFKGAGFYETDYKRKRPGAGSRTDDADPGGRSDDASGGAADAKPATKPDAASEAKPDAKPETRTDAAGGVKATPKPEPRAGTKDAPKKP